LRLRHSRLRAVRGVALSALAVVGGGIGVYAVLAIAFHMLVEPSLGTSHAGYKTPPASVAQVVDTPAAAPAPSPPIETTPRPSFAAVAAVAPEPPANPPAAEPKAEPKPVATRTRHSRSRHYWNSWNAWGFSGSFGRRRWF
jgi:hypothetical protein